MFKAYRLDAISRAMWGPKMRERKEPWKELGLNKSTYYYQLKHGKLSANYRVPKTAKGRYSGLDYKNSQEKLESIREKYRNGVPSGTIEEWLGIES